MSDKCTCPPGKKNVLRETFGDAGGVDYYLCCGKNQLVEPKKKGVDEPG